MGWWKDDGDQECIVGDGAWDIFGKAIHDVEELFQKDFLRDPTAEEIMENFLFVYNGWVNDRGETTAGNQSGLTTKG